MSRKRNKNKADLSQARQILKEHHSTLGNNLYIKMYNAFPELQEDKAFARKGILWYTLHNQVEAVYRIANCKEALDSYLEGIASPDGSSSTAFSMFLATIDSLKLILINLIGDLGDHEQSYYVLDDVMALHQESSRNSVNFYLWPTVKLSRKSTDELQKKLNPLQHLLNSRECNHKLSNEFLKSLKKMFSVAVNYSSEVDAFTLCDQSPETLLYGYRRVTAAGLNLLSNLILVQSLMVIVEPFLWPV